MALESLRRIGFGALILVCLSAFARTAHAQYGTSFYYFNPRTGQSYSQQVYVGQGSAYGGFSYGAPGRYYSAGSGYNRRAYFGGNSYASRRGGYGQRYYVDYVGR